MTKNEIIDHLHGLQDTLGQGWIDSIKTGDVINMLGHIAQDVAKIDRL